jgi:septal ring factor EnvC (AmiA/AmiB activator)
MDSFKEHFNINTTVNEEQINEEVIGLIWTIAKDLLKISWNISKMSLGYAAGAIRDNEKGPVLDRIKNAFDKQARAEKKAEKVARKANRLTQYKQARQKLLSAQDTIAREQKKIKALDRAVIRRNAEPINKIKKDLADMAKKLKAAEKKLPV